MQENIQILLIDYLDNELGGSELAAAQQLLNSGDSEVTGYMQSLQLATEAVRYNALFEQVGRIKEQYQQDSTVTLMPSRQTPVRSMVPKVFRIAAVLVLLVGAGMMYKFATTSASGFQADNYQSYDLSVSRGGTADAAGMEELYRNGNWNGVITRLSTMPVKDNKSLFLAGMSNMETRQFDNAIDLFRQVMARNAASGDNLFQDEAEYYLALAYIADNQSDKGVDLLYSIRADKNHLFHHKALSMSWLDLKILKMKGK